MMVIRMIKIKIKIVVDVYEKWGLNVWWEKGDGLVDEVAEVGVEEDGGGLAVEEEDGDGPGVEAGVEVVEDEAGHGDGELELEHGGDVGGEDGDDGALPDPERGEGGGNSEAAGVGLGPCEGGAVVDKGRAVAVDGGCSLEER